MSGLLGGSTRVAQAAPTIAAPTPMPDTQDPAVLAERRRALAEAAARGGRASTIMSGSGTSGAATPASSGDSYASRTLGAG